MHLEGLTVVHQRKSAHADVAVPLSVEFAFQVETCLRRLFIGDESLLDVEWGNAPTDHYHGVAAYEFLLRVASGLESEIAGESEVFGQFRAAWREFEATQPENARSHSAVVQRLFEDVKEIRARHLQSASAVGYGGLVRHLLGNAARKPTLLVGAGQMAQSVLPYLGGRPLFLWNRTRERALALRSNTPGLDQSLGGVMVLKGDPWDEIEAWRTVANVIVCVPPSAERDALRVDAWRANPNRERLLHLGLLESAGTAWQEAPGLSSLHDLFALQSSHSEQRSQHAARARAACREKARLRSLGGPASLAHGWEDLSLFASTA